MNFTSKRFTLTAVILVVAMVMGVMWGTWRTELGVERAVRQNFVAAGLLSQLQVEGEKMRRYEKEMFIYVANNERRANYVKEFDGAYTKLLNQLDTMLAPSGTAFTDDERKQILAWKEAALFYTAQFAGLARRAEGQTLASMTPEQRLGLTLEYNDGIKAGKDRFRELLGGTEKMRAAKEAAAQNIAGEIDSTFQRLRVGVMLAGGVVVALLLLMTRQRKSDAGPGRPMGNYRPA
jgi:hypothetical protein